MADELPRGRYLSCAFQIGVDMGGQTRAMLMRNRILARAGGARPDIVTFGAAPGFAATRAQLREQGLLTDELRMLNLYEHYREHGWGRVDGAGATPLADLSEHRVGEDLAPDGSVWRTRYEVPGEPNTFYDYRRPDGSPFLRMHGFQPSRRATWPRRIEQIDESGAVIGELRSVGQLVRRWIRELTADDERVFVFVDSRFLAPILAPLRGRRIHVLYQMHNMHLHPPYRWDGAMSPAYERVFAAIDELDAMVSLTRRQRDDIAERRGRTSNMFVIPNPVETPAPPPEPPPRDPRRVITIARLEEQKRLPHAIAAFEQVVAELPDARLDIYGRGSQADALEAEIARRGLTGAVTLRGFHHDVAGELARGSAFLLSSVYEGYPLSTIESMAHGCPVVSYDIRYGPREQITDGVDGFLVPDGDVAALAARVVELLRSPELVERMSAAAIESAARRNSPGECLASWAEVLNTVVERRRRRTRIESVELRVDRLGRLPLRRIALDGALAVTPRGRRKRLGDAEVTLAAIDDATGAVAPLPLTATLEGADRFTLRARMRRADLPRTGGWLRLRLTWENSAWQTELARIGADGVLSVSR